MNGTQPLEHEADDVSFAGQPSASHGLTEAEGSLWGLGESNA